MMKLLKRLKKSLEIWKYIKRSKFFDENWYLKTYKINAKVKPYFHYYHVGWKKGYNPSSLFDTNEYLENNSDVKTCPLFHYEKYRKKEIIARNKKIKKYVGKSIYFDKKWYMENYKIEDNILPYMHYYETGWKQGFNPSISFDTNKYLEFNPDVDMCPLYHYEKYGKKEGRKSFYINSQYDYNYKEKKIRRFIKRKISNFINCRKIERNKDARILVYAHIFYVYSVPEIIEYLKNLEKYNYDLIVTVPDNKYFDLISKQIIEFKGNTKIIKCENRGFDVGPFMEMLHEINLDNYDILFKLQSKGTFHRTSYIYGQIFKNRDWFEYMFESVLGAFYVHKNIDLLSKDNNIGVIAADNLIIKDPIHKKNFTMKRLEEKGLKLKDDYNFVAGTVFAERVSLLKNIKGLNYRIKDFEPTETGYFSFAHAMERYITGSIDDKFIIYGNRVCRFKRLLWGYTNKKLRKVIGARMLDDNVLSLSDDFALRYIEHTLIKKYEVVHVKVGDLNTKINGIMYKLNECYPFLLINGNEEEYIKNCLIYRRTDYMDLSEKDFRKTVKKDGVERYKTLMKNIDENNYDVNQLIVINENDSILDGQHRACYLFYKYGEDYEVKVLKIYECKNQIDRTKPFFNKYE